MKELCSTRFSLPFTELPRKILSCAHEAPRHCGVEQSGSSRAHNPEVVGSNPAPATKNLQLVGLAGELFLLSEDRVFGPILGLSNKISICNS